MHRQGIQRGLLGHVQDSTGQDRDKLQRGLKLKNDRSEKQVGLNFKNHRGDRPTTENVGGQRKEETGS